MKRLFLKLDIKDMPSFWVFMRQFLKFGIVGVSNAFIALAIYYILLLIGVHYILSYVAAFVLSVLNAYYWNAKYVFKKNEKGGTGQLAKVFVSYGFVFVLSMGLLFLMVDIIGISELIAPLLNLCITVPLNFLLNKFWALK
jgi:putative flippase GtrA